MTQQGIRRYTASSFEAPGRLFQITRVSRTHTQLWLQSDASATEHRLEVLFQWVQFISAPFVLSGLYLREATPDERARISERHALEVDPRWGLYLLSRDHDWFVVSGNPIWAESNLAYDDEPVFWSYAGREDLVISVGTMT
ncbi:hypothetical protein ABT297_39290 [Dactylosporangium sp. NPDC000555]|uniref:hypothetical protein n=1 Tax=Dactylosporangium sp. NPDC000555 TaxID=3154260 RepID=UPI0033203A6A